MKKISTTLYFFSKKNLSYLFIFFFSFYMTFSSHVFALRAEAPERLVQEEEEFILSPRETSPQVIRNDLVFEQKKERERIHKERVQKIQKYFQRYNLPLEKYAENFVRSAERYGVDWRLLAAISFIESTGGKFACGNGSHNAFGWASCKVRFSSYPEAIEKITRHLAGLEKSTSHFYKGKSIREKLEAYNPPSVVPDYADKVIKQMKFIESL